MSPFCFPSLELVQEWNLGSLQKLKETVALGINIAPKLESFQIARTGWLLTQGLSGIPDAIARHPTKPGFLTIAEGGELLHLNPDRVDGKERAEEVTMSEYALSIDARTGDSLFAVCGADGEVSLQRFPDSQSTR